MVSKNQQKIGEANGVPNLPIVPTQITKTGNVGSLDLFKAAHLAHPNYSNLALGGRVMH